MESKRLDIIVPCYNEEQNIEAFYEAVQAVAAHIEESSEFECS
jgi:glycosyltransferase involved in cell wall biosynthesis